MRGFFNVLRVLKESTQRGASNTMSGLVSALCEALGRNVLCCCNSPHEGEKQKTAGFQRLTPLNARLKCSHESTNNLSFPLCVLFRELLSFVPSATRIQRGEERLDVRVALRSARQANGPGGAESREEDAAPRVRSSAVSEAPRFSFKI